MAANAFTYFYIVKVDSSLELMTAAMAGLKRVSPSFFTVFLLQVFVKAFRFLSNQHQADRTGS